METLMRRGATAKRIALALGFSAAASSACASDFNSVIAEFFFLPAHLFLGCVALGFLLSRPPRSLGIATGALLSAATPVSALLIWQLDRPKSLALAWADAPGDVVLGAFLLIAPVLLAVLLLGRSWRTLAA
jgi:hypothetical protein